MQGSLHLIGEERIAEPADETDSFEMFVLANHARLFGALCLLTGDRFEAEDIAQEAYLRLLERWDRVASVHDPVGYLYRTAMNVFRRRYRRARVALLRTLPLAPRDPLAEVEERDAVVRALAGIPIDQRAALVATVLLGYTSEEAASVLRAKPSTIRARATRGRAAGASRPRRCVFSRPRERWLAARRSPTARSTSRRAGSSKRSAR